MLKVAQLQDDERARPGAPAGVGAARRPQTRYFAFLSYSHRDQAFADWLHRELEKFWVPSSLVGTLTPNGAIPRRLTPIFRDQQELSAARELGVEIESALAASQFLIVICSPDAARSRWANAEVDTFKRSRPEGCVLAAIVAGEPFASESPGREQEECFPPALRQRYDRRGRPTAKRAEPLAADFREAGDGRRTALLKLIAGILGIGLDDLVQRATTRRQRRLAVITAASLAGMALTSGLAVTAFQARDAARDQRREAEGLVAFMLGDLKDKLEPVGRLDALDGVGARVLAYYSKQDATELSDAGLLQRARALSLTAQVAYQRGNYDNAARLYREAMAGTAEAVRRAPDDPHRLFDHAQNVFWMGDLARRRGNIGQAEAAFREYGKLAAQMVAAEPDNLKWRMEAQYARENLGIVHMSQRRYGEAARQFEGALSPMQSLAALDPANNEYRREVSNVLAWLADARLAEGRLDDAIALRQRQVAFLDRLSGIGTDVGLRQQLIPARRALGLLYASRGEIEAASEQYRLALGQANRLIPIEPDNSLWKDLSASVNLELAKALVALRRLDEARQEAMAGCDLATSLRSRGPNVAGWQALHTNCLDVRARLALAANDQPQALAFSQQALDAARSERSGDPIADRFRVAAAYRLLGDARQRMRDPDRARTAWAAGLAQVPLNVTERPWEMSERAELLERVGRGAEAEPLVARLTAMGYRSNT
jgi:tetratricopeptide (TPR) repeat protein